MDRKPVLADVYKARQRLLSHVQHTPLRRSVGLSRMAGVPIHLKLECLQTTGSFKLRGASNALLVRDSAGRARGVVAASTGNHGRALAYAAQQEGVRATICVSRLVPQDKLDAIRALDAQLHVIGSSQDDAQREAERLARDEGLILIPPFDDDLVIAGQGTIGLELLEDLPELGSVLVPLSGGGLIAGIALALKSAAPAIRVIGVSMERGCAMHASLAAGHPVVVEELPTLADSLGGGIGVDNRLTFGMAQELVDDVVLVGEADIAAAIRFAYQEERLVIEGAAAVGIAALLAQRVRPTGSLAVIVSGANIDMGLHRRIIAGAGAGT